MIKIILVSATYLEIEPTLLFLEKYHSLKQHTFLMEQLQVTVCVTNAGMVNTAFELGKFKGEHFDVAINAGLAGSFGGLQIGDVVNVTHDCFSEWGAENDTEFLSIDELGFGKQNVELEHVFETATTGKLPKTSGITVNTVHGNEESIKKVIEKYHPVVESMEGAAFMHAANLLHWKGIQLRAISNKVEKRNRENWNIPLAIKNLNGVLIDMIKEFNR